MVGNNTSVTDGRGATAAYTCDALSRLTEASQPLSTGVTPCSEKKPSGHYFAGIAHTIGNIRFTSWMGGPYSKRRFKDYALSKGLVIGTWGITFDGNNAGKKGALTWENGR